MITVRELAWLGGLLEGEGSFMLARGGTCVALQTTDRDVAKHVAALMGVKIGKGKGHKPKGPAHYKRVFAVRVYGTRAIGWMFTLYPFMGERRRAKIREVIATWRASPRMPRAPRGRRFMATCHPDRVRSGLGLCHACYMVRWRSNRKAA